MLIAITVTSGSFLLIIGSFVFASSVMFSKASPDNGNITEMIVPEFDSMHGEIDFETSEFNWREWVIFIINSILLPIVLLNFLIAKMTSKYEELEEQELFTGYIEKAKMIGEIELFYTYKERKQKDKAYVSKEIFTFLVRNSHNDVQNFQEQIQEQIKED